jgi:translation initiation factor 1
MAKKKRREYDGMLYSTARDSSNEEWGEQETLPPDQQTLYVSIDRKQRKGKEVTLVEGFAGHPDDLKELGKRLKSKCGVGGTAKDGEIIIQGNMRDKVMNLLEDEGYSVKRKGG